jgi:peroxiredoxin
LAFGSVAGVYAFARLRAESARRELANVPAGLATKHAVTTEMAGRAVAQWHRPAPPFRAMASDGRERELRASLQERPVFLVFIKDGCPCSEAAQPFFNELATRFGGRVEFLGVIDGDVDTARRWADGHQSAFPILADADLALIHAFGAESSAHSVLVDREGEVAGYWPGYSAGYLTEIFRELCLLTSESPGPIDLADAPTEPTTGCPFD